MPEPLKEAPPVFTVADENGTMSGNLDQIIQQYKSDKESVYYTWFINSEERLKAFRSVRRGVI